MRDLLGPWLADIAANFLAIVLIVLVVVSRYEPSADSAPPAILLEAAPVAPLSGSLSVDLLRQRLRQQPEIAPIDLTPETEDQWPGLGPDLWPDLEQDLSRPVVLFVLHPAAHGRLTATLRAQNRDWRELTVPEALKTPQDQWSPEFLALADVADRPNVFLDRLERLLVDGHRARGAAFGTETAAQGPETFSARIARWLILGRDLASLALLAVFMAVFWGVRQWATRA